MLPLQYRLRSGPTGSGEAVNMSSCGLLFRADGELPVGELIEVRLDWPFFLSGGEPLQLVVWGIVVRKEGRAAAISVSKYEFLPVK